MKKIIYLIALITTIFIGCEKDYYVIHQLVNTPIISDKPVITPDKPIEHTVTHNISNDSLNLLIYNLTNGTHKSFLNNSIPVNDTFQYVKIISYYSEDYRQRNIHELEIYSDSVNIALNKGLHDYENLIYNSSGLSDGLIYDYIDSLRLNPNDSANIITVDTESTLKEFMVDGNLATRWSNRRIECDTNYIGLDTITVVIDLRKSFLVDSIKLHLGWWTQVFDLLVSTDNINWKYIEYPTIITESIDALIFIPEPIDSTIIIVPEPIDSIIIVVPEPTDSTIITPEPEPIDSTIIITPEPIDSTTIVPS
jgi:hypothetical protein